jgi:putative DNA primase/helicase
MPEWLSDALCRLATGGAFGTRTLHTNAEETLLSAKRPVIINSIGGVINRPDLQDRAIVVEAPFIPESERRTEAGLRADFEEAAPVIFSGLLDGISAAMRAPVCEDTGGPRLIDFMRWVGPALEYYGYTGLEADYAAMRDEADILALENDPVALALVANIEGEWTGTSTELSRKLTDRAPATILMNTKVWPQNAKAMGRKLARIAPVLRRVGLEVSDERIPGGNRTRTKVIRWSEGADREASGRRWVSRTRQACSISAGTFSGTIMGHYGE